MEPTSLGAKSAKISIAVQELPAQACEFALSFRALKQALLLQQGLLDLLIFEPKSPVADTDSLGRFCHARSNPLIPLIDHGTSGFIGQPLTMYIGSIAPIHPRSPKRFMITT